MTVKELHSEIEIEGHKAIPSLLLSIDSRSPVRYPIIVYESWVGKIQQYRIRCDKDMQLFIDQHMDHIYFFSQLFVSKYLGRRLTPGQSVPQFSAVLRRYYFNYTTIEKVLIEAQLITKGEHWTDKIKAQTEVREVSCKPITLLETNFDTAEKYYITNRALIRKIITDKKTKQGKKTKKAETIVYNDVSASVDYEKFGQLNKANPKGQKIKSLLKIFNRIDSSGILSFDNMQDGRGKLYPEAIHNNFKEYLPCIQLNGEPIIEYDISGSHFYHLMLLLNYPGIIVREKAFSKSLGENTSFDIFNKFLWFDHETYEFELFCKLVCSGTLFDFLANLFSQDRGVVKIDCMKILNNGQVTGSHKFFEYVFPSVYRFIKRFNGKTTNRLNRVIVVSESSFMQKWQQALPFKRQIKVDALLLSAFDDQLLIRQKLADTLTSITKDANVALPFIKHGKWSVLSSIDDIHYELTRKFIGLLEKEISWKYAKHLIGEFKKSNKISGRGSYSRLTELVHSGHEDLMNRINYHFSITNVDKFLYNYYSSNWFRIYSIIEFLNSKKDKGSISSWYYYCIADTVKNDLIRTKCDTADSTANGPLSDPDQMRRHHLYKVTPTIDTTPLELMPDQINFNQIKKRIRMTKDRTYYENQLNELLAKTTLDENEKRQVRKIKSKLADPDFFEKKSDHMKRDIEPGPNANVSDQAGPNAPITIEGGPNVTAPVVSENIKFLLKRKYDILRLEKVDEYLNFIFENAQAVKAAIDKGLLCKTFAINETDAGRIDGIYNHLSNWYPELFNQYINDLRTVA